MKIAITSKHRIIIALLFVLCIQHNFGQENKRKELKKEIRNAIPLVISEAEPTEF